MRTYERNGVHVDQCNGCGGLFLDRGELERLASAESAFYDSPAQPAVAPASTPAAPQQPAPQHHQAPQHHDRGYDDRYGGKRKKSKKRSFLEEFFD